MQPDSNHDASGLPLIQGLEEVNAQARLVQVAWENLARWQDVGARCAMTRRQLAVARALFLEAIEGWAMAVGHLLAISREEPGFGHLTIGLEEALRGAATYLGVVAAIDDDLATPLQMHFNP